MIVVTREGYPMPAILKRVHDIVDALACRGYTLQQDWIVTFHADGCACVHAFAKNVMRVMSKHEPCYIYTCEGCHIINLPPAPVCFTTDTEEDIAFAIASKKGTIRPALDFWELLPLAIAHEISHAMDGEANARDIGIEEERRADIRAFAIVATLPPALLSPP